MAIQTERLGLNIPSDTDYVGDDMFWKENIEKIDNIISSGTVFPTTTLYVGRFFLRTDLNKPCWYTGANWIDANGTVVN